MRGWLVEPLPGVDSPGASFNLVGRSHGLVTCFDFRQTIDDLLFLRRFDAHRKMPAGLRKMRTLEDGESGFQPDEIGSVWRFQQFLESLQRGGCQFAHLIIQNRGVFALGIFNGSPEFRLVPAPMMNGGSVDAGLPGGGADGESLSEGADYLGLSRRQAHGWNRRAE